MKISIKELRSLIREAVDKSYVDPRYARLKSLAKGAIVDLKSGGDPEEVYAWLAAETDLGRGQHRADAVVVLVRKVDPAAAADLDHAGRPFRSAPAPYVAPWSGNSGKMYESAAGAARAGALHPHLRTPRHRGLGRCVEAAMTDEDFEVTDPIKVHNEIQRRILAHMDRKGR